MYTYHDSCTCTLLTHDSSICDMTHAMTHPCVTWLIHVWQDSRLCDTTHVHAHYSRSIWMRMSCVHVPDSYHEGTSHVTYDTHTHKHTHTHTHTYTHTHTHTQIEFLPHLNRETPLYSHQNIYMQHVMHTYRNVELHTARVSRVEYLASCPSSSMRLHLCVCVCVRVCV